MAAADSRWRVLTAYAFSLLGTAAHRVVQLPNGDGRMPVMGLGTADAAASGPPFTCADAVEAALRLGYRHLDTAVFYQNHRDIAEGIARSGVPRDEIWITSKIAMHGEKIPRSGPGAATTDAFVEEMLAELQTPYIDLVLMHFPGIEGKGLRVHSTIEIEKDVKKSFEARKSIWQALEKHVASGRVRNIGVSNFMVKHLEELKSFAVRMPSVNQLELHPYLPRRDVQEWCRRHGVVVSAYGSVVQDIYPDLLGEAAVKDIARSHDATPAQVALAWALQKDIVVLPKSSKRERIKENAEALELVLSEEDMHRLDALDCASTGQCRFPTRCGEQCQMGSYYWDPALVPAWQDQVQVEL